jgi:hypothetical protein
MDRARFLNPNREYAFSPEVGYMHDLVAERMLGRPLKENEWVDHINDNGLDNRSANIIIYEETANGPVRVNP